VPHLALLGVHELVVDLGDVPHKMLAQEPRLVQ